MIDKPSLLQACLSGSFGTMHPYEDGCVCEAGFIFLLGNVNLGLSAKLATQWHNRMFVCFSKEWEKHLAQAYPALYRTTRYQMHIQRDSISIHDLHHMISIISTPYAIKSFDEAAYRQKPFSHGANYPSYPDFKARGAGAVIWYQDKIVASASSFFSYDEQVELDISTSPAHRKKGLGLACAASMLLDCKKRGIRIHWDAQNPASKKMAEKLGYAQSTPYCAYSFVEPESP